MAIKQPRKYGLRYLGDMSTDLADAILKVQDMEVAENFRNTIYLFPPEIVEAAKKEEISVRQYIKNNGIDVTPYIGSLRDYQTVGVAFLYLSPRSIISDGVGLGKTVQISALLNVLKGQQQLKGFVIAVEKSAIMQTTNELISKTGLNIIAIPPEKKKLEKVLSTTDWDTVDGCVLTHTTLTSNEFNMWLAQYMYTNENGFKACKLFDTFFLDESAVAKNNLTRIHRACANFIQAMRRVHFMNATMFELSIKDIYNQLDLVNPVALPKYYQLESKYCCFSRESYHGKGGEIHERRVLTGYKNTQEFKDSLKLFIFGRYIEDTNLYETHYVMPTTLQLMAINSGSRYMEVLNCPTLLEAQAEKKGEELRYPVPFDELNVPKLKKLKELLIKYKGKKIMIYTFHKEAQQKIKDLCTEIGLNSRILNGTITKTSERQEIIDGFNTGDCPILITNIKKSLNLYDGDICILYSIESNPAKLEQIRGRIERNVDGKTKLYIMLVYKHTGEYALFADKLVNRGKSSRKLSTDAKTAIDYFIEGKHYE